MNEYSNLNINYLFHTSGKCCQRFSLLYDQIVLFLEDRGYMDKFAEIKKPSWRLQLAFLTDMMSMMNDLNLELQGRDKLIVDLYNKLKSFTDVLKTVISQFSRKNFIKFDELSRLMSEKKLKLSDTQFKSFQTFLNDLQKHMDERFTYITGTRVLFNFVQYPFVAEGIDVAEFSENLILNLFQVDNVDSLNTLGKKFLKGLDTELFRFRSFEQEWIRKSSLQPDIQKIWSSIAQDHDMDSFPLITKIVARTLSFFGSTWLNESAFSTMKAIKTKFRSNMSEETLRSCMRICLYSGEINLDKVVDFSFTQNKHARSDGSNPVIQLDTRESDLESESDED